MPKYHRRYTRDFKVSIVQEIEAGKPVAQAARENDIHPSLIARWRIAYSEDPENAFRGQGVAYKEEARIAELERVIGRLYAENEFLKKALTTLKKRIQEEMKRTRQV